MNYLKNRYTNWNFPHFTEFRQFQTVETSCTGLLFHHARPQDFVKSQWICFTPICFTIYRVILAILLFVWIIFDFTRETIKYFNYVGYTWITYATNWAFIAFTLIHISLATYCLIYNIKYPNNEPKFYQPLWFMYNLSSTSMFVICVLFWFELSNSPLDVFASWQSRVKHSLTAILVLIDTCLCAIPVRMIHVIYPFLAGFIYCLFTYLFWLLGGSGPYNKGQIYPAINWSTPQSTVLACLGGLMTTILCHVILYTIYFVRVNVSAKFGGRGYMLIEESTERHGYDNHEFELGEDTSRQEGKTSKIQNPKTEYQKYGTVG
ncbi:hypothetical protein MN116_003004 [Schistosoma mekongi]|uniref:Protein rolling stone n=1 Tax=Schistosoma mekongi TaxID=38744 RepID=A0AAE1ZHD6_SCHME|nr:hypothetical protein MN116_003004 [Schistosoma mekongi]